MENVSPLTPWLEESYVLEARFAVPPKGPPERAVATLALIKWLRERTVHALQSLRPDLVPSGRENLAPPVAYLIVFNCELTAVFLELFANDIVQRYGWSIIFEDAGATIVGNSINIKARARVRRPDDQTLHNKTLQSEEAKPPATAEAPRQHDPRHSKVFSASVLIALGLSSIVPAADIIAKYPDFREGAVLVTEDLKQAVHGIAEIFSKLLGLSGGTVTFEKAPFGATEST